jgi:hypothetical protein
MLSSEAEEQRKWRGRNALRRVLADKLGDFEQNMYVTSVSDPAIDKLRPMAILASLVGHERDTLRRAIDAERSWKSKQSLAQEIKDDISHLRSYLNAITSSLVGLDRELESVYRELSRSPRNQSAKDYYPSEYEEDAQKVFRDDVDGRVVSICSFLPDYPSEPFFQRPAERIDTLIQRDPFVVSVFWEVLADQAFYSRTGKDLSQVSSAIRAPKLVGLLASARSNVHPVFLLIALSLAADGRDCSEAIAEIGSSLLNHLKSTAGVDLDRLVMVMAGALHENRRPDSIRAFVPNGDAYRLKPRLDLVNRWCAVASETLLRNV